MEFDYDGGGLAKGGLVTLYLDGEKIGEGRVDQTEPFIFSAMGNDRKFWSDIWSAALQIGESIRTGKPQAEHDYANMPGDLLEEFMEGMHAHALEGGTWFARNYDFSSCQRVLDAGGGSGGVAIGLAQALPHLQVTVAELPFYESAGISLKEWRKEHAYNRSTDRFQVQRLTSRG
jgi:hypothetical protein